MSIQTVEERIWLEWNWVKASIATHPYLSVLGALLLGGLVGHFA